MIQGLSVDAYFPGLDRSQAGVPRERRYTVGTRLFGTGGPFDYNFEGIY
jgi:hypothetical protein